MYVRAPPQGALRNSWRNHGAAASTASNAGTGLRNVVVTHTHTIPIGSLVVPFWGYLIGF